MKKYTFLPLIAFAFFPLVSHADFPDIPKDSEYYQSISALQELGIVQGYENGQFDQNRQVSRAEFLKMALLGNMKSEKEEYLRKPIFPGTEALKIDLSCFPDVKETDWLAPYVCWAKEEGIVNGYEDGNFHPDKMVNMAEAAKIMTRWKNESIEGHWANGYFAHFSPMGLPATIQSPDQILNRANTAELIWRYNLATPEELVSKPGKIFVWNKDHFLKLDHIGTIYNYVVGQLYAKDENKVYNMQFDNGDFIPNEIVDADPKSFKVVTSIKNYGGKDDFTYSMALDNHALYMGNEMVPQSAGGSFELLDDQTSGAYNGVIYGKDAENVYPIICYEGCGLANPYPDADLGTFEVLDFNYSKDKDNVYFIEGSFKANNTPILLEGDANSFEVLGYGYAKDSQHVFYLNNILKFADKNTFKVFNENYFTSGNNLYYMNYNPENETDDPYYMGNNYEAKMIEGADLDSFEVFSKVVTDYTSQIHNFAKDKSYIYYSGKALVDVDVATFHYDSSIKNWKDKNKAYTLGEIHEMAGL